jgi:site-specific DNA recombinase
MHAAIYARKSTEQRGVADEAKSVPRQIALAREYAASKGWTVDDEHVYSDDAVSGAPFERPEFIRLMETLKPRPPFQSLIVADLDRIGREQWEMGFTLKRLFMAGLRIFEYQNDHEVIADDALSKFTLTAKNLGNELQREKSRQHTRDSHKQMARAGHVTGGRVYGYKNVDVLGTPDTDGRRKRLHVVREVQQQEAEVVRRIFDFSATGKGYKAIADTLNQEGVIAPKPRGADRRQAWAASTVREILHRPLYKGEVIWGQRRKKDPWGRKTYVEQPEQEWVRHSVPALRIVSDEQWQAAHERLGNAKAVYLRGTDGKLHGRPSNGVESKYLLTGLLSCAECGGAMIVVSSGLSHRRRPYYACGTNRARGSSVCGNGTWAPLETMDNLVLGFIAEDLLREGVIARVIEMILAAQAPAADNAADARAELQRVENELANLTAAIASGGDVPSLVAAVRQREAQRTQLRGSLDAQQKLARLTGPAAQRLIADVQVHFAAWRELLKREPVQARQIARKLIEGRLACKPTRDASRRYYEVTGTATLGRALAGATSNGSKNSDLRGCAVALVTPAGFEPAISTLKGLRPGPG